MDKYKWDTIFVQNIPKVLEDKTFYICLKYNIVAHLCACGCQRVVYTPIDRKNGWTFTYDGYEITLSPSIGNYGFPCKSHYYVKQSRIIWMPNKKEVEKNSFWKRKIQFFIKRFN